MNSTRITRPAIQSLHPTLDPTSSISETSPDRFKRFAKIVYPNSTYLSSPSMNSLTSNMRYREIDRWDDPRTKVRGRGRSTEAWVMTIMMRRIEGDRCRWSSTTLYPSGSSLGPVPHSGRISKRRSSRCLDPRDRISDRPIHPLRSPRARVRVCTYMALQAQAGRSYDGRLDAFGLGGAATLAPRS